MYGSYGFTDGMVAWLTPARDGRWDIAVLRAAEVIPHALALELLPTRVEQLAQRLGYWHASSPENAAEFVLYQAPQLTPDVVDIVFSGAQDHIDCVWMAVSGRYDMFWQLTVRLTHGTVDYAGMQRAATRMLRRHGDVHMTEEYALQELWNRLPGNDGLAAAWLAELQMPAYSGSGQEWQAQPAAEPAEPWSAVAEAVPRPGGGEPEPRQARPARRTAAQRDPRRQRKSRQPGVPQASQPAQATAQAAAGPGQPVGAAAKPGQTAAVAGTEERAKEGEAGKKEEPRKQARPRFRVTLNEQDLMLLGAMAHTEPENVSDLARALGSSADVVGGVLRDLADRAGIPGDDAQTRFDVLMRDVRDGTGVMIGIDRAALPAPARTPKRAPTSSAKSRRAAGASRQGLATGRPRRPRS
ncbi:hypothetical protein [Streptomyces griseofuscus]|uniref:hypothetical protein n=1 Tax=Streptomyces griseofuscus TaxID=146922 RepID=UPI0034559026